MVPPLMARLLGKLDEFFLDSIAQQMIRYLWLVQDGGKSLGDIGLAQVVVEGPVEVTGAGASCSANVAHREGGGANVGHRAAGEVTGAGASCRANVAHRRGGSANVGH